MKKIGSKSEFIEERDRELYANFLEVLRTSRGVALRDMFGLAAKMPASRFWVSEGRALDVVSAMQKGRNSEKLSKMLPQRKAMYREIARRVEQKMDEDPALNLTRAIESVVSEPAPEFYMEVEGVRSVIYAHRRKLKALRALKGKILQNAH